MILTLSVLLACFSSDEKAYFLDGDKAIVEVSSLKPSDSFPECTHILLKGTGTLDRIASIFPNAETLVFHYTTDITNLPSDLSQLTRLRRLSILGTNIRRLPADFEELNIDELEIGFHPLLEDVPNLPLVQSKLSLHHNRSLSSLPNDLGNPETIKKWDFSHNQLRRIPNQVQQYKQLQSVSLQGNRLLSLPEELLSVPRLSVLEISNNPILNLPSVRSINRIQSLELHNVPNLMEIQSWDSFPSLEILSIRNAPTLRHLPMEWKRLKRLQSLSIVSTNLTSLSLDVSALNFLDSVSIRMNRNLDKIEPVSLPRSILNVVIEQNAITSLPDTIGSSNRLRLVRLDENLLEKVPQSLCVQPLLEEFSIANNPIGSFCSKELSLPSLHVLNLQGTLLEEIPIEVASLQKLEQLSLGGETLKEVPRHLFESPSLRQLLFLPTPTSTNINVLKQLRKSLPSHMVLDEL